MRSATAKDSPQEAKMPKVWKNKLSKMGKGSLSNPKMRALAVTKPARRSAMKALFSTGVSVLAKVKSMKAITKTVSCRTKRSAGDQVVMPPRKMPQKAMEARLVTVKQELSMSATLSFE